MIGGMIAHLVATLAAPAAPANSSVYTELALDRCTLIEQSEEWESLRCPGHATIPLFVSIGDGRVDIDAGLDNGEWESLNAFNRPGPRVEWRLNGREPIAVIYRLIIATPEVPPGSALIVATIGRRGRPGCRIATIDGALPDANARARAAADRAPRFRCGIDRPEG